MNPEIIQTALVAAVVISYGIERILKPLIAVAEGLGEALIQKDGEALGASLLALYHLWPFYVSLLVGGLLAWYTGLDFLPVFAVAPVVGRLLSCAFMGMGPAVLYDLAGVVLAYGDKLGR